MLWRTVYDLAEDSETVACLQDASLNRPGFGLKPEPELFGSEQWWRAIDDGVLAVHAIEGTITRSYLSGHNDFPEFDLQSDTGEITTWQRRGNENGYAEGAQARVSFVVQHFNDDVKLLREQDRVVSVVTKVEVKDPHTA
jgi:hypothetical protein